MKKSSVFDDKSSQGEDGIADRRHDAGNLVAKQPLRDKQQYDGCQVNNDHRCKPNRCDRIAEHPQRRGENRKDSNRLYLEDCAVRWVPAEPLGRDDHIETFVPING
jgi:hypothetical protein